MLSVTNLATYLYCPRKSFLEIVFKIRRPPNKAMVKGSVRHNAFDFINNQEEDLIKSVKTKDYEELLMLFKKNHLDSLKQSIRQNEQAIKELQIPLMDLLRESWESILKETEEKVKMLHTIIVQKGVLGEDLWNSIEIKTKSEMRISSDNLKIRGIIDRVLITENEMIPYELKTGSAPITGVWPGHRIQIGSYILLLHELHGKTKSGYIKYLDINEERAIMMNPFLQNEILGTRDTILSFKETLEIPPFCDDIKKCQSCELRTLCYNKEFVDKKLIEVKSGKEVIL
jgi:CRISPR/Cas system-associated exonuclease Cas4 (RecB family)